VRSYLPVTRTSARPELYDEIGRVKMLTRSRPRLPINTNAARFGDNSLPYIILLTPVVSQSPLLPLSRYLVTSPSHTSLHFHHLTLVTPFTANQATSFSPHFLSLCGAGLLFPERLFMLALSPQSSKMRASELATAFLATVSSLQFTAAQPRHQKGHHLRLHRAAGPHEPSNSNSSF